jgi:hypothetical protein
VRLSGFPCVNDETAGEAAVSYEGDGEVGHPNYRPRFGRSTPSVEGNEGRPWGAPLSFVGS